jgi:hypothetical protein
MVIRTIYMKIIKKLKIHINFFQFFSTFHIFCLYCKYIFFEILYEKNFCMKKIFVWEFCMKNFPIQNFSETIPPIVENGTREKKAGNWFCKWTTFSCVLSVFKTFERHFFSTRNSLSIFRHRSGSAAMVIFQPIWLGTCTDRLYMRRSCTLGAHSVKSSLDPGWWKFYKFFRQAAMVIFHRIWLGTCTRLPIYAAPLKMHRLSLGEKFTRPRVMKILYFKENNKHYECNIELHHIYSLCLFIL